MGHKEDLLEGAKRCLVAKGFVRTTARDIVAESGTNLASIGYHYGSKDALLVQAYVALMEQAGEGFDPGPVAGRPGSLERFEAVWSAVVSSLPQMRGLWLLSVELVVYGDELPEVRRLLAEASVQGRSGLTTLFTDVPEAELDDETLDTEGRLYQTLLQGLMVQWIFDQDSATSGEQLTAGLRRVMAKAAPAADPAAPAKPARRPARPARRAPGG
jgi:AcrR family transcriptional regulator